MRRRRVDVEVFASRAPELQRRTAGEGTWRCRGMELGSSGAREVRCRHADVEA